jgi:hypothetical protein
MVDLEIKIIKQGVPAAQVLFLSFPNRLKLFLAVG